MILPGRGRIAGLQLIVLTGVLGGCALPQGPFSAAPQTYVNPVLERDFPDPAVLRAPDGWFYAYATQSLQGGKMINVQVARSPDLVHWTHLGDALPEKPSWARGKQQFWAPHVIYDAVQRKFFMYYSAEPDGGSGKCLAVAVSAEPAGPFADSGAPLICGEGIEDIDPMAFDDPRSGMRLLYWGSGSKPIKVRELSPDRLQFLPGSAAVDLVAPDPVRPYRSLVEGAWVVLRNGSYYLFYSGDRCCAPEPSYAIMVARSNDALGPFEERGEASGADVLLAKNGSWLAPGHNSVATDDEGNDWILYHAIDARRRSIEGEAEQRPNVRVMLLERIEYRDGWPRIAGGGPSAAPRPAPVVRPPE